MDVREPSHVKQIGHALTPWARLHRQLEHVGDVMHRRLCRELPPSVAALCSAVTLGRAFDLPEPWKERLRNVGAYHFVAVSGLHIGILGATVMFLLRRTPLRPIQADAVALVTVAAYALLTGARTPVLRATLLFAGWLWQRRRQRVSTSSGLLAFSLLLLILLDPNCLHDPGTHLSFAAVAGILVHQGYRTGTSPRNTGRGLRFDQPLRRAFHVAIAASLATAPICAYHFGQYAPWSPLTALLIGPLILPLFVGSILIAAGCPAPLSTLLSAVMEWLVGIMDELLHALDHLPGTPLTTLAPSIETMAVLLLVLLCLHRRRPLGGIILVLGLAAAHLLNAPREHHRDAATVFAVGHGQAVLIRYRGQTDLIDAGPCHSPGQAARFRQSLEKLGVGTIDRIFVSHLDADHCGLIPSVLRERPVGRILLSAAHRDLWNHPRSTTVLALRRQTKRHDVPVFFLHRGQRLQYHQVGWPPPNRRFLDSNAGSLVLRSRLGPTSLLIPGDVGGAPLAEVAGDAEMTAAVLILPHHGNPDPSMASLLDRAQPLITVASRGSPLAPEVGHELAIRGIPALSTDKLGTIRFPLSAPGPPAELPVLGRHRPHGER